MKTGGKVRVEDFIEISVALELSSFFKLSNPTIQKPEIRRFFSMTVTPYSDKKGFLSQLYSPCSTRLAFY